MREGSYTQIEKGMRVVGRDGETLGAVQEVLVDEGSGIFVGLVLRPKLFVHSVTLPGDAIDRLHDGVVYTTATPDGLKQYQTASEKFHEVEQAYQTPSAA